MSRLQVKDYQVLNKGMVHGPNSMGWDLWVKLFVEGQCDCGHTFDREVEAPLRAKHVHLTCCMCKSQEWTIDVRVV